MPRQNIELYGINVQDGTDIEPLNPLKPVDDVTGKYIPHGCIGIQDGLVKDVRPREGSWEKSWRTYKGQFFVMYDPELGYPTKAAGDYD